jgi:HEAT repeat protein
MLKTSPFPIRPLAKIPRPGLVPAILFLVFTQTLFAQNQPQIPRTEPELIALLRSDAPEGDKALACKFLSVYGSSQAVPELAKLLGNERLSSWSRTALEAIPGAEADEALRKASESLQGRQLVGVINSIGVRRDGNAVEVLAKRLSDSDADVATSAAVARGGSAVSRLPTAAEGIGRCSRRHARPREGCICVPSVIWRLATGPRRRRCTTRFAEVRMLEATRGAILARGKEGIPLLVEQLRSDDKGLFQIGLSTAREFPAREVDQALAAELDRGFPERAALILVAMADRKGTVDVQAVLKAAQKGAAQVRIAAVDALGRIGNAAALPARLTSHSNRCGFG